jgi:hypothetical protein
VQTPQQFYDWFALIDRSVAHSQEAHFRQHLLRVSEHLDMCDRLVSRIDQVDAEVSGMMDAWKSVEEGGKSLQDASQKLLDERVSLSTRERAAREIDGFSSSRTGWSNYKGPLGQPWSTFSSWSTQRVCSITQGNRSFSKPTFSIWSNVWTSALSSSNPTYDIFSAFCPSRSYSHPLLSAITKKRKSTSYASSNA